MTHFGPKSARFPCENANLPHCTYFIHIHGPSLPTLPPSSPTPRLFLQCSGRGGPGWLQRGGARVWRGEGPRSGTLGPDPHLVWSSLLPGCFKPWVLFCPTFCVKSSGPFLDRFWSIPCLLLDNLVSFHPILVNFSQA